MSARGRPDLERVLHRFFIAGLAVSTALVLAGILRVLASGAQRPDHAPSFGELARPALLGEPLAWLYAGLVALMLVPVARVLLMVGGFLRLREWRFATAAIAVLSVLLFSMALGMR